MRVSISPNGSVIGIFEPLPARLSQTGNQAFVAQFPKHDPRQAELAIIAARTTSQFAAVADAGRVAVTRQLGHLEARDEALGLVDRGVIRNRLELRNLRRGLRDELLATLVLVHGTQFRHD